MKRRVRANWFQPVVVIALGALCAAGLAVSMRGQAGAAAPKVAPAALPAAPAPAGQPQGSTEITTIRAYSNLVVIDVVVSDSQGNPVHGLKAEDFSLFENNKLQNVRHFEEHSAAGVSQTEFAPAPKLPEGLFSNKSAAPVNGPVNVLLLDYLNTPLTAQPYARQQLIDYLNKAPAGTRIAIFGLTTKLSMLQGFTTDTQVLKNALNPKKGGAPQVSQILSDPVNGGPQVNNEISSMLANDPTAVDGMLTQQMVDDVNRFETIETSFQQDIRAQYTLNGFDMLARYLIGIPGRKNVIWFSGSFPLDVLPDVNAADPNASVVRNDDEVRKTDNLLTRAQIAMYPVDARGVMTNPSQNFSADTDLPISVASGAAAAADTMAFMTETAQEHETMEAMAEDTGGHAFYNTNNLTDAVQKAIQNGSNYYTLTYTPSNMVWDARFRSLKVKVDQPGVKLAYRNGYYAVDPNDRNKLYAGIAATASTQPSTMATAMIHGGPNPAEILFKVRIRPADVPPIDAPLKSNQTNPDPKIKVEGPYREYGVDLVPDPHAVSCRADAAGNRHCAIEVWTFVYDTDGDKLITASNRLHTLMTPADYAKMQSGGMAFHQEVSVPVRGQYFLRTAIHDMVSDRVGAVEVPVAAVAKLAPLQAEAAPAPVVPLPAGPISASPVGSTPAGAPPATAPAPADKPAEPAASPK